jgi:hypothetical protein
MACQAATTAASARWPAQRWALSAARDRWQHGQRDQPRLSAGLRRPLGAAPYSYDTVYFSNYYYAAPGWYRPWVYVGDRWTYRPYPYHDYYYRAYRPYHPYGWGDRGYYGRGYYGRPGGYGRPGWGRPGYRHF